jgi:hypothetical protein
MSNAARLMSRWRLLGIPPTCRLEIAVVSCDACEHGEKTAEAAREVASILRPYVSTALSVKAVLDNRTPVARHRCNRADALIAVACEHGCSLAELKAVRTPDDIITHTAGNDLTGAIVAAVDRLSGVPAMAVDDRWELPFAAQAPTAGGVSAAASGAGEAGAPAPALQPVASRPRYFTAPKRGSAHWIAFGVLAAAGLLFYYHPWRSSAIAVEQPDAVSAPVSTAEGMKLSRRIEGAGLQSRRQAARSSAPQATTGEAEHQEPAAAVTTQEREVATASAERAVDQQQEVAAEDSDRPTSERQIEATSGVSGAPSGSEAAEDVASGRSTPRGDEPEEGFGQGPAGQRTADVQSSGFLGDPCAADADCRGPKAICIGQAGHGICSQPCVKWCPDRRRPSRRLTHCVAGRHIADLGPEADEASNYCLLTCDRQENAGSSCPQQSSCVRVPLIRDPSWIRGMCSQ